MAAGAIQARLGWKRHFLPIHLHLGVNILLAAMVAGVVSRVADQAYLAGLLRWLRAGSRRCRGAYTAEPLLEPRLYGLDAEALAAIQPLTPAAREPQVGGFQPGGGSFGGGGASGGY